jgi:type VI secretion system protein VasD
VQVYQLKDRQKVDAADYQKLLRDADNTLKEDIVASKSLLVMPKGSVTLNMPMSEEAKFVAVVGLFNRPDIKNNTWKLVLSRDDLDPDKPRTIQINSTGLTLLPVKE